MNQIWSHRSSKVILTIILVLLLGAILSAIYTYYLPKPEPVTKISVGEPVKSTITHPPFQTFQGNISSVSAASITVANNSQSKTFPIKEAPTVQKIASASSTPIASNLASLKPKNRVLVMFDFGTSELRSVLIMP